MVVALCAQRSGLGCRMLEYAEQSAREAGDCFIKLYNNEAMTKNIDHYSHIGYSETHQFEEKGSKRFKWSRL